MKISQKAELNRTQQQKKNHKIGNSVRSIRMITVMHLYSDRTVAAAVSTEPFVSRSLCL